MPYQVKGGVIAPASVTCDTCQVARNCNFDRKRLGGFKGPGQRARNIGFRLITDGAEGHEVQEGVMSCFQFVEVMNHRMLNGRALRDSGKDGEAIAVIAQEGGTVRHQTRVGVNGRGEVIRPHPTLIEPLKAAGHKVNREDRNPAVEYIDVTLTLTVPPFGKVASASAYKQEILEREMARQQAEEEAEDAAFGRLEPGDKPAPAGDGPRPKAT
jgi:hypothetical protein